MTLLMNIKLIFFFNCRIKGIHLNMVAVPTPGANIGLMLGSLWPSLLMPADKVHLVYPLSTRFIHIIQETGYFHLQATTHVASDVTVTFCLSFIDVIK